MSGHSKWSTIKRAKGKADAARGKLFGRLIKEIAVAARTGGGNPEANPRLRSAVATAKSNNMPNKNIDNAIAKGTGQVEGVNYEEVVFEAYAPGGVAVLIETLTDSRNRTVAEIRHVLNKGGGSLGEANSVQWMFSSKGVIGIEKEGVEEDSLMEAALEAGAEDMKSEDEGFTIYTEPDIFENVRKSLEDSGIPIAYAQLEKIPQNTVKLEGAEMENVQKLIETLDDLDDTQNVYSNLDED